MSQQTEQSNTLFVVIAVVAGWYLLVRPQVRYTSVNGMAQPYVSNYLQSPYAAQQAAMQQQQAQASMWTSAGNAIGSLVNKFWGSGGAQQTPGISSVNTVRSPSGIMYPAQPDDSLGLMLDNSPTQNAPGYGW